MFTANLRRLISLYLDRTNERFMKIQNYGNHKRYYPAHHFVFYPVLLVLIGFGIFHAYMDPANCALWIFIIALLVMVGWLSFMVRQHYGMTVQDRIIFLELRYRYFVLTGQRFENLEKQLRKGQLFALRFASDEELPALAERAVNENLGSDEIKRAITNWKADWNRV